MLWIWGRNVIESIFTYSIQKNNNLQRHKSSCNQNENHVSQTCMTFIPQDKHKKRYLEMSLYFFGLYNECPWRPVLFWTPFSFIVWTKTAYFVFHRRKNHYSYRVIFILVEYPHLRKLILCPDMWYMPRWSYADGTSIPWGRNYLKATYYVFF